MSHHTEGDRIAMTLDEDHDEENPFPFAYEDDGESHDEEGYLDDMFDEATYQKERAEEREYAIREQSVGVAMQIVHGRGGHTTAESVIEEAEKIAAYLRGRKAA